MDDNGASGWFEDYAQDTDAIEVEEYDITVSPNDFNVMTLYSFVESGAVQIPGFQRNFVWDLRHASRLIESLILGLPIPQLFLYEQQRNQFLVIDGQQRLMSIYYFVKMRFPKTDKRTELREVFHREGKIPDEILHDDKYFQAFNLRLPDKLPNQHNRFKNLNYSTLGEHKVQFDLRPLRNIVVKQNLPSDDDSSIYEIFNRLNSGGITLSPQEIRNSMYHSNFYELLYRINNIPEWRRLLDRPEPDLHRKDVEILLRGFAMLIDGKNYVPSMAKFLNQFSNKCKLYDSDENNQYLDGLFQSFLNACSALPKEAFVRNGRFHIALYESAFTAACEKAFQDRSFVKGSLDVHRIRELEKDRDFAEASHAGTTQTSSIRKRLDRARKIIGSLDTESRPR